MAQLIIMSCWRINAAGESSNSTEVSATPFVPFYFMSQPNSFTSSTPVYVGTPITFSAMATNNLPLTYQWFEICGGITNVLIGQTNAAYTHLVQSNDVSGMSFFVTASNGSASIASWTANLVLSSVLAGASLPAVSVQFALTNYSSSSYSGYFLAPAETAGVYAVSNWNVWPITPSTNGTQPGVTLSGLKDFSGAASPVSVTVVNVSDGWHQSQSTTGSSPANQRLMNTFWKVNPNKSNPSVSTMFITLTNVPNGVYSAYFYFMQNVSVAKGNISAGGSGTVLFQRIHGVQRLQQFRDGGQHGFGFNAAGQLPQIARRFHGRNEFDPIHHQLHQRRRRHRRLRNAIGSILTAPNGLLASVTNGQVKLVWNSVFGATGYNVQRATNSGGLYIMLASNLNATNFTDAAVTNGVTYYYVVSALNPAGETASSIEISADLPLPRQ